MRKEQHPEAKLWGWEEFRKVRKEYHVERNTVRENVKGWGNVEVWKRDMRKECTGGRNVRGEGGKI